MTEKFLDVNENIAMDIEQLTNGGFSPLKTFMNKKELDSVLENMRLPSGKIWPIPILFPKPNKEIKIGEEIILKFRNVDFATITICLLYTSPSPRD